MPSATCGREPKLSSVRRPGLVWRAMPGAPGVMRLCGNYGAVISDHEDHAAVTSQ
jgi:hypothetical protein